MNRAFRFVLECIPWLLLAGCMIAALNYPAFFESTINAKDSTEGSGWIENLTVLWLVIGVVWGIYLLIAYWNRFRFPLLRLGVIVWILGCIYFAGEEISWGQWYFQWKTPETLKEINYQKETNLHNINSWFNEKPRTLVEFWMIFAGLVVPVLRKMGRMHFARTDWREWFNPAGLGISTCLVFLLCKGFTKLGSPGLIQLGRGELREMLTAYFLALFIISVHSKLKSEAIAEMTTPSGSYPV